MVDEPIAVVGMSCRLPGAPDVERFWQLLRSGGNAVTEAPADRWPEAAEYRQGGFLDDVAGFDARFFGISPNEAAAMDPQQRLMLELAWEALEHARIAPTGLRDACAGVYFGAIGSDYATLSDRLDVDARDAHTFTGSHRSMIANRVSYLFGLRGPSMTVDAGQSSSLLAVQMACEELRRGDTELALAGGVNLNLLAETSTTIGRFGALSPDGRCYTFDSRANGYVRGEGGGIVVLKPLAAALADGDQVHCVILGGASNNGSADRDELTRPSQGAQEEVIRLACKRAGVASQDVHYVELHGTGTPAGDPVEAAALGATLGATVGVDRDEPVWVGSVKTNIGHLEGAAGVAGLMKVVLCLKNRELVPSLNFDEPNPNIPLDELRLDVVRDAREWPEGRRVAGVSSFGIGGTNCHLVLAEAPETVQEESPAATVPLVLSARSAQALKAQAGDLAKHLATNPSTADVALSLLRTRARFDHRAVVAGADRDELLTGLEALAEGRPAKSVVLGRSRPGATALVFPGQGSQWVGMARDLLDEPVFARRLAECAEALAPFTDYTLVDVLRGAEDAPGFDRVDVVQPALWAVMVSLAEVWRERGVVPDVVVGHSQGEIAAATVIGALSIEDAARVVALRSRAIAGISGGGMMSIQAPLQDLLDRLPAEVTVAAVNGPRAVVVSGSMDALTQLKADLPEDWRSKILPVDYASHSPAVDVLRDELRETLAPIRPRSVDTVFVSTLTGEPVDTAELDGDYWFHSLRNPVRFADAARQALAADCGLFVECSPHPVLVGSIEDIADEADRDVVVVGTLHRAEPGPDRLARSAFEAFVGGADLDLDDLCVVPGARRTDLPTYPFQRARHWLDGVAAQSATAMATAPTAPAEPEASSVAPEDLRELVIRTTADVLGYAEASEVDPRGPFREQGIDSVGSVELRNRLKAHTGLRLPTTVLFDFPTPDRLIKHLQDRLSGASKAAPTRVATSNEPIAIVSMGCRYPGGIASPEDFWRVLSEETDAITSVPTNRGWDVDSLVDKENPENQAGLLGGFLQDADRFDAAFFGLSPREALGMDPQQRLLLETSWEALERAGIEPSGLAGSLTGVFVGAMAGDYGPRMHQPTEGTAGHLLTGTTLSVASGRIAYTFGLLGPAITVDTACSSSLVALNLAVQSLRRGECSLALAGGATVMSNPGILVEFSKQNGLAADGRAKAFADGANGTAFAEGVGLLVLERLSDARKNGHPVLGVVRGVAVNSDGASNGLTAPNGQSQQLVIRQALADAGLAPGDVDAVEAHGTGTALGDPIEAHALLATYGADRDGDPLWLGSVKSNIGHTQAAAGVAGVMKMVLGMRHGTLPRSLHVDAPSSRVDWEAGAVELLAESRDWTADDRPLRAAVSSFGISGTNAHVILESVPAESAVDSTGALGSEVLVWVVSARSVPSLRAQAARLRSVAESAGSWDELADVARVLAARAVFEHRAVVVAGSREDLWAGLNAVAEGEEHPCAVTGSGTAGDPVFVFPGQGAQWVGMALELLADSSVFRESLQRCDAAVAAHTGWSVIDVLRSKDEAALWDSKVIQPVLFAVMVSLAELWRSVGIDPTAVVGHSQGEIAAAAVSGALTLDEAARVVVVRSDVLSELDGSGGMVSVMAPAARAEELIAPWQGRLWVAVDNGPLSSTVGGDVDAIEEFLARCADVVQMRRSPVSYAAHTPHVAAVRDSLIERLGALSPVDSEIVLSSSCDSGFVAGSVLDADYWLRNVAEPVRFDAAVRACGAEYDTPMFVEVSAHPILVGAVSDILGDEGFAVGSLRRGSGGVVQFGLALAEAFVRGAGVDWTRAIGQRRAQLEVPTYAFDRRRFWLEPTDRVHPLLDQVVSLADGSTLCTGRLSVNSTPWLADHGVRDEILVPGTAFVEFALAAAAQVGAASVGEVMVEAPLVLRPGVTVAIQVSVQAPDDAGRRTVTIHGYSAEDEEWVRHVSAVLEASAPAPSAGPPAWPVGEPIDLDGAYAKLAGRGYRYGPAFQGLKAAWRDGADRYAEVRLPVDPDTFTIHPALLDAALHVLVLDLIEQGTELLVPYSFAGVQVNARGTDTVRVHVSENGTGYAVALYDANNQWLGGIDELALRPVAGELSAGADLRQLDWVPLELTAESGSRKWAVLGTEAEQVADAIKADGFTAPTCYEIASVPEDTAVVFVPLVADVDLEVAEDVCDAARDALSDALDTMQQWVTDERFAAARLVFLLDRTSPALAPVVGLVRTACVEHPGRFGVADVQADPGAWQLFAAALDAGETQCSIRDGEVLVPRIARRATEPGEPLDFGAGPVLVTGGTSGLGALVAQRLVEDHDVHDLVLVSRRGPGAPGVDELVERLTELGATVQVKACDVTNRVPLSRLLKATKPTAVVHAAGVLEDATIERLSPDLLDAVLAPKLDAAWLLHELTDDLSAFVTFSSIAGVLGNAGQGNYAAANTALDALAEHRRSLGLPAVSIAWGVWASGMAAELTATSTARLAATGVGSLTEQQGLGMFDALLTDDRQNLVIATKWDTTALRAADYDRLPTVLRGMVKPKRRVEVVTATEATTELSGLAGRLAAMAQQDASRTLVELVRGQVASTLGHQGVAGVDVDRPFSEMGFDSLTSVELRNRLNTETGLRLPPTLVFNQPTVSAVAEFLRTELVPAPPSAAEVIQAAFDQAHLDQLDDEEHTRVTALLQNTTHRLGGESTGVTVSTEPIAIVSMGCRFPGGVESPEDFWRVLADEVDAISGLPTNRGWDLDALAGEDVGRGGPPVRHGGFLYDADEFDAEFFGLSPREALGMDPQQRLLLETSWQALQRAGIEPPSLAGSLTGVFVGAMDSDYGPRWHDAAGGAAGHLLTGTTLSVASGRVAYTFGLRGPALTIDTACSSSLVAINLAVQSLRRGECTLALAGGVTMMSNPGTLVEFSRQNGLAADGRAKAFADGANGTVFAEGVGLLVLERLSDARKAGHPVLGIVRGSAVNSDGASNGLTAPNGQSQEAVIRQALADARLSPSDVDAVEAHGTGTALGDPIEASALAAVYGRGRDEPVWLGSVKSNIGHTQAAAGVAGVMKMVLGMQYGKLPKTLHVDALSSRIDWDTTGLSVLTEARDWAADDRPRRAGVSSFGISGTNAHVILESAPAIESDVEAVEPVLGDNVLLWVLSAKSRTALRAQAAELLEVVACADLAEVGRVLASRTPFAHRAVVVAGSPEDLRDALAALAAGTEHPGVVTGTAPQGVSPVFVFPGQGAQWTGMALRLLEESSVFGEWLRRCDAAVAAHTGWSVIDVLRSEDEKVLWDSKVIQPVLFAVMVSLAELWRSVGVDPAAVVGHSQGEIAAAAVSGALSLDEAARVVVERSDVLSELDGTGGMVSVLAPAARAEELIAPWAGRLWVAVDNGPSSSTVGGDVDAIEEFLAECGDVVQLRRSPVGYAAHTPHVREVSEALVERLGDLSPVDSAVRLSSSCDGAFVDGSTLDTEYWLRNVAEPVRFDTAVRACADEFATPVFVEVSAHPILLGAVDDILVDAGSSGSAVGSLRRNAGGPVQFGLALAGAFVRGTRIDWGAVLGPVREWVPTPTYAFDRSRYWLEPADRVHPLLDRAVPVADGGVLVTGRLSVTSMPWLADHGVRDDILLPGTAFVEFALAAGAQVGTAAVSELMVEAPLVLPAGVGVDLQVSVQAPDDTGRRAIAIHSRSGQDAWIRHATGELAAASPFPSGALTWPPAGAPVDLDGAYERLAERGYRYGPVFQGLTAAWRDGDDRYAEVELPVHPDGYTVHPALLDAALHVLVLDLVEQGTELLVPHTFAGVQVDARGTRSLRVHLGRNGAGYTVNFYDAANQWVGGIDELALRPISDGPIVSSGLRELNWVHLPVKAVEGNRDWAVIGSDELAEAVRAEGFTAPLCSDVSEVPDATKVVLVAGAVRSTWTEDPREATRAGLAEALDTMQQWVAEDRLVDARLVFLVDRDSPVGAPIVGLVRSAAVEHPGRFGFVDVDAAAQPWRLLAAALDDDEAQCVLDADGLRVPRIVRRDGDAPPPVFGAVDDGPVLVTGGTGGLGGLVAQRLVERHGAKELLLVSRRGPDAPGVGELVERLTGLGAAVRVEACDVTDRDALGRLLAAHPPSAVVHAAGVLADATVERLTPERLDTVLAPKVDAAWLLHELTEGLPLRAFVMFSSLAGQLGNAGQGNYAAANTFLDALARHRQQRGLAGSTIAYGLWAAGMAAELSAVASARMAGNGVQPLSERQALAMFDAALGESGTAPVVAANWDTAALRASSGEVPVVLRGMVARKPGQASGEQVVTPGPALADRLASLAQDEASKVLTSSVRSHVAATLGQADLERINTEQPFSEMGFDSLTSVELRNRLSAETGLRLPATLVFNQPTVTAVAAYLLTELVPAPPAPEEILEQAIAEVTRQLEGAAPQEHSRLAALLQNAAHRLTGVRPATQHKAPGTEHLVSASDEEIFDFIDGF